MVIARLLSLSTVPDIGPAVTEFQFILFASPAEGGPGAARTRPDGAAWVLLAGLTSGAAPAVTPGKERPNLQRDTNTLKLRIPQATSRGAPARFPDRKSTRLNSSHLG